MTDLLHLLLHERQPRSVESLVLALQWPRHAVVAKLDALREAGCELDDHPHHGVRLVRTGLATWCDYVQSRRSGRLEVYRTTASTQDLARQWVEAGLADLHRAVVVADRQTAGRGRLGRTWVAPAGSAVMFSYVWVSRRLNHDQLTAATAVALAQAIESLPGDSGLRVRIKWPNDLLIDSRKVAGILVERIGEAAIIGVGVNVTASPGSVDEATSLRDAGVAADRLRVLTQALHELDGALAGAGEDRHVEAWRSRCLGFSGPVRLRSDSRIVEGEVVDADPVLGLIVRTAAGAIVHLPAATTGRL